MGKGKIRTLKDRSSKEGEGFTLLELTVVLLLLGFILLLTFPNFRAQIFASDIKRSILGLVGEIKYAQSQAATTKKVHRLMIDVKDNIFWVMREEAKGRFIREPSRSGQPRSLPPGISFLDVIHPDRGRIMEGQAYIDFYPTGWAEESTVHLQRNDEVFTIFINSLGGRVEVNEGYWEKRG